MLRPLLCLLAPPRCAPVPRRPRRRQRDTRSDKSFHSCLDEFPFAAN
ncbi:hypothetical protein ACP70R_005235 [Stipagrostis hirtigluma subsp. patula]